MCTLVYLQAKPKALMLYDSKTRTTPLLATPATHLASSKIHIHLCTAYPPLLDADAPTASTGIDNTLLAIIDYGPPWTVAIAGTSVLFLRESWESVLFRERRKKSRNRPLIPIIISIYFFGTLQADAGALPWWDPLVVGLEELVVLGVGNSVMAAPFWSERM